MTRYPLACSAVLVMWAMLTTPLLSVESAVVVATGSAVTRTRGVIDLVGLWRFQPAESTTSGSTPSGDWGAILVPGNWLEGNAEKTPLRTPGKNWGASALKGRHAAWYERQIAIPADWAGRRLVLQLDRVSTDAAVFIDDRHLGAIAWPAGELDLTEAVRPGATHVLRLLVLATSTEKEVVIAMGANAGQNEVVKADIWQAGLLQEARLVSRPFVHIAALAITPSVRQHELAITVALAGISAGKEVTLTARLLNVAGKEEKRFTASTAASATETDGERTISATWPWADPRLWDLGKPELYTLRLDAKAAGFDDEIQETFGFREFWIEGKDFLLNGSRIRLRPMLWGDDNWRTTYALGANFMEIWPGSTEGRGRDGESWYRLFDTADRVGVLVNGVLPDMGWMGTGVEHDDGKVAWQKAAKRIIRRYRNHPSIVMWGTSGNMLGTEIAPTCVGQRQASRDLLFAREPQMKVHYQRAEWGIAQAKALDATRPLFIHNGGSAGDVYCPNWYPNWTPLQEREDLLSEYAAHGDMPMMVVEFGTPLYVSAMRGRNNYGNAQNSEPLMSEYLAIYQGNAAYRNEPQAYRAAIIKHFKEGQSYDGWHWDETLRFSAPWQQLQQLFLGTTWRSWRTWGITGGMIAWDGGNALLPKGAGVSPAGETLRAANGDLLAWICGPATGFTNKAHHWRTADVIHKQVAVLNDSRQPLAFTATWSLRLADAVIDTGTANGHTTPASTTFVPLNLTLPATITGDRVEGSIELTVRLGDRTLTDRFPLTVFTRLAAPPQQALAIIDPVGKSTALLQSLGCTVTPWNGASGTGLVVIGRQALTATGRLPAALESYVRGGGRALVFAQEPEACRKALEVRVAHTVSRRVYPVDPNHPVVAGLTADDLRDWNAAGTLIEPYPAVQVTKGMGTPVHGWHWGNHGSVSSAVIEKPHFGGWRPLLECEFDLAYSPLMEVDLGKGRLIWCQLDLEDQAASDPVAERLARQLLTYSAHAPLTPRCSVAYDGDDAGRTLLASLGITPLAKDTPWTSADLLVMGSGASTNDSALRTFLSAGGRVLVLAQTTPAGVLGTTLAKRDDFSGAQQVPAWTEARGLSLSDVRRRTDGAAWLLTGGCEIGADGLLGRLTVGRGTAFFMQADPAGLDADARTYLRLTRWRLTRALSQVLANLGAESTRVPRLFQGAAPVDAFTPQSLAIPWRALQTLRLPSAPHPVADPGISAAAADALKPMTDTSSWKEVRLPTSMEECFGDCDGEAVFRTTVTVPPAWRGKNLVLNLGAIDDFDSTFVNGVRVGATDEKTLEFWSAKRVYPIPAKLIPKDGRLDLAIRMFDRVGGGGIGGTPGDCSLVVAEPPPAVVTPGWYHPDYRTDFALGDDPYRVYNW